MPQYTKDTVVPGRTRFHALGYDMNAPVRLFILRTSLRPA